MVFVNLIAKRRPEEWADLSRVHRPWLTPTLTGSGVRTFIVHTRTRAPLSRREASHAQVHLYICDRIRLRDRGACWPVDLQLGIEIPFPINNDLFGEAISLSGGRALIGAELDATKAPERRAYLYDATSGTLPRTFENPTPATNDQFGGAVSLSGNRALVGAQNDALGGSGSGVAYLFDTTTGGLLRTFANPGPLSNIVDNFGHAVAIDGNRALISAIGDDRGANNAGAAYLFDTTTGALIRPSSNPTPGSGDNFGQDVALFGNRALISTINDDTAALNAGAAYLFDTTTGALLQTFLNPTPELNNSFGNNDDYGFVVALTGRNPRSARPMITLMDFTRVSFTSMTP